jgi:hypothetical protein
MLPGFEQDPPHQQEAEYGTLHTRGQPRVFDYWDRWRRGVTRKRIVREHNVRQLLVKEQP